jgi:positive regulator of sigma E activity
MDNPRGIVTGVLHAAGGRRATIEIDTATVCSRCASGRGCGAGLWMGGGRSRQVEAAVDEHLELVVGDTVRLKLAPKSIAGAAMQAYGAPLLGAVAAVAVAHGMALGDVEAAAASLAGLAVGSFASRLYAQRPSCLARLEPRIDKVL